MHALIITGKRLDDRLKKIADLIDEWGVAGNDQVVLALEEEATSIGIAQVRAFQKRLQLAPYSSPYTVGIIRDMHTLTTEAQNALLKTLEEPPPHAKLIGETPSTAMLLPTVLSRAQLIDLGTTTTVSETDVAATLSLLQQIQSAPIGKRLNLAQPLGESREKATTFVDTTIPILEHLLRSTQDEGTLTTMTKAARGLLTARQHLQANVTPRLAIDTFVLSL